MLATRLAQRGVQLALTPVGKGAVALEASSADAGQQATEEIDPGRLVLSPPFVLVRRTSSTRATARLTRAGGRFVEMLQCGLRSLAARHLGPL